MNLRKQIDCPLCGARIVNVIGKEGIMITCDAHPARFNYDPESKRFFVTNSGTFYGTPAEDGEAIGFAPHRCFTGR